LFFRWVARLILQKLRADVLPWLQIRQCRDPGMR
jgi:hypothetical protein